MIAFLKTHRRIVAFVLLSLLILLGLYYRIIFCLNVQFEGMYEGSPYTHDEYHYIQMAKNLLEDGRYGYWGGHDAYVTPGYPLFMTGVMSVFGTGEGGILAVKIAQALMSAASVYLVFLLCMRLTKKMSASLIAATFMSMYPPLMLYSRYLLTETPYIFFILLYFNVQLWAFDKKKPYHAIAGALFGLTVLVRPMVVVLLPLPYIFRFFTRKGKEDRRALLISFAYFAGAVVLVMAPWWIRNLVTLNKFIPLATQANPFYAGVVRDYKNLPASSSEFSDGLRLLWRELTTHPLTTIKWYTIGKLDILFSKPAYSLPSGVSYLTSLVNPIHVFLVSLGALGTVAGLLNRRTRMVAVYLFVYIALSLLFIPTSRFGLQYMPFLAVFAGWASTLCFDRARSSAKETV